MTAILAATVSVYAQDKPIGVTGANIDSGAGSNANVSAGDDNKNPADVLELHFFGSGTCLECLEIKNALLYPIGKEFPEKLKINYYDTDVKDTSVWKLMLRLEKQHCIGSDTTVCQQAKTPSSQELFFPDTVLLGYESIMAHGRAMIEEYLNDPQRRIAAVPAFDQDIDLDAELKGRLGPFLIIVAAAFVDSINPCAIATIIFLVSFLATQKRKRTEVLAVGFTFAATVFATYLLLGIGALELINVLIQNIWIKLIIRWSAVTLAGLVGILSIVDALRFKKSGDAKDIKLQLPKSVKLRIHKIITENMTGKKLIAGTVVTGFLVTLLEAVCTGQVYLPTIAMMAQQSSVGTTRLIGWMYLIMYNFIFVVPLLAVMVAAYYGMKWTSLSKMMQKNMTLMKLLLGAAMIVLALYLAFA
jgi:cytochrome c biogenesis protein CcdA